MAIVKFRNEEGRVCVLHVPPRDLSQVEAAYTECDGTCSCATCARAQRMTASERVSAAVKTYQEQHPGAPYDTAYRAVLAGDEELRAGYAAERTGRPIALAPTPPPAARGVVRFDDARVVLMHEAGGGYLETTGAALAKAAAAKELDRMVRLYLRDHPGADYSEGMRKVLAAHPSLRSAYLGLPADGERLQQSLRLSEAQGRDRIVETAGGARFYVTGGRAYAKEEIPKAPGIAGGAYISLNGVRRVQFIDFDLSVWSLTGAMEFLREAGFTVRDDVVIETNVKKNLARFLLLGPEATTGITPA